MGELDVDAMLSRLPHHKFIQWQAYAMIEPFGFPNEERRFAILASIACKGRIKMAQIVHRVAPRLRPRRFMSARELKTLIEER